MMISVIASQIIYPTVAPTVEVMATSTEGQAKFMITNNSSKTVTMYYKRDTDFYWEEYSASPYPTSQIKDLEAPSGKSPGDEMTLMCYAKADDEVASTIVEVDNVYFLPRTTTAPTVTGNPSANDPGWAVFNIKNNDPTKVRVYYKLLTDSSWNSDNTLNSGADMDVAFEGTPGYDVTLQVYCQSETETTYVSTPTVEETTTYREIVLLTPAITEIATYVEGQIKFQLTHINPYAVDIKYKIGSASYVTLSNVPSFDIDNPDSIKTITYSNNPITPGDDVVIQAYSTKTNYTDSSVNSKTLTYLLPRTVATPSITSSAGPSVGMATFVIKNEDQDAVMLHYRQAGGDGTWTNLGSTSSGLTRQVILTGDPNTMVTLQAKATPITLPAYESEIAIKGQLTKDYEGTSVAPSIVQQPYAALGYIKVQFQNNDGLGTLYYRRGGESWSTVQLMTGETLDKTYSGTQGAYVEISAYFKADVKLASSTTIFGGYYYRNSTAPSITSSQGATAGIAIFTIKNEDSATAEMFYRNWYSGIGAEVDWISLGNVNSGLTKQQSLTGNPGSTLTLEARVRAVNNAGMSATTSKSQVTKDRAASPTITSRPNDVPGQIIVRIINAESTSGTLYYRRNSESYTSYAVSGSGYIDVTYTGTPKGSITVEAYYVTSGKDTSLTTTYYGYYLKPADVELYQKYVPGDNWQAIYNTCSANVNILNNPLSTYDYLQVSTLYSYYDTSTYTEAWATTQDAITSYGTHYRNHVVITVGSNGAISVQAYGAGPDGGFLHENRVIAIYGKYN